MDRTRLRIGIEYDGKDDKEEIARSDGNPILDCLAHGSQAEVQLFSQFPPERRTEIFARLDLPSRQLPEPRVPQSGSPAGKKKPPPRLSEGGHNCCHASR